MRVIKSVYPTRWKNYHTKHPRSCIVCEIYDSPNSVKLWKNFVANSDKKKVKIQGNNIFLYDNYSERRLIRELKQEHVSRNNIRNL
jgi:hypothetical protein